MPQNSFPWTGAEAPTWADIKDKPTTFPPTPATPTAIGGVLEAAHQAHSTAVDVAGLVTDFNALLDKLVAAGIMAAS